MSVSLRDLYQGKFKDKRLDKRASKVAALLYESGTSSIHAMSSRESEEKASYRFFANEKVDETTLIDAAKAKSNYLCTGKEVLVIQDTTEFCLNNHRNRLKRGPSSGIGLLRKKHSLGFLMHCSLVLEERTEMMLGFSDIQLWHREEERKNRYERKYGSLPMEEKESYKWIKACKSSMDNMRDASGITFIEDREGDIYEQFANIPNERTHLIIRSKSDRNLSDGGKLFSRLCEQPIAGSYKIDIVKDARKEVPSRTAEIEVRFCKIAISKSMHRKQNCLPASVDIYAVEAKEINYAGKGKVLWRILTTKPVTNYRDAVAIIDKYKLRWYIEQLHRLLKQKGFQIESTELTDGWAIRKLTVMLLSAALRVMQLLLARDKQDSQPLEQVFSEQEIICLKEINKKLEGDTESQINKYPPDKLCWATWTIARLAGWKSNNRARPPGPILLKKGLDKFLSIFQGWTLAQELFKDVS